MCGVVRLVVALIALLVAIPALAQTTGAIRVTVTDEEALPIPGVLLSIQYGGGGTEDKHSDAGGEAVFRELLPGMYELTATKAGFTQTRLANIAVHINRTTDARVALPFEGSAEEITVSAQRSVVLHKDFLKRIPTGRSYQSAVPSKPGSRRGGNPNMAGGSTNENRTLLADPVGTEHYTDYGINGVVWTAEDALSTFAVDVDTASYTITRRRILEGYLPPTDAVRVEEFVNYFPYEYARPDAADPFTVDFEAAVSPWDADKTLIRVGVQGRKIPAHDRKPVHLTFLVDTSCSMKSADKLDLVKRSLEMLTEELDDGDTVAIATYAGSTSVVLQPTPISDRHTILRSLSGLYAGGSTAMASGIDLAYEMADAAFAPADVNRVIVCSDGDANVGPKRHAQITPLIKRYARRGITLTTLGYGSGNYKDTMMERLANDGDGNYFYIDGEREARRVLVDKLGSTMEVIAKDVKIQVDWNPDLVETYRLVGYENRDIADEDFRRDEVDAGEIGSGHQVTALYEVTLHDRVREHEVATVRVRNKAPGRDAPAVERQFTLDVDMLRQHFDDTSAQFRIATSAAWFAEILRGSPHMEGVGLADIAGVAQEARRVEYAEDAELVQLIRDASRLRTGAQ